MSSFVFNHLYGWLGLTGVIIAGCIALGYFFPPLRRLALEIGAIALTAATIYTKGNRDEAARQQKLKDEAVRKAQEDYGKIDSRPDTVDDVDKRLRDGSF